RWRIERESRSARKTMTAVSGHPQADDEVSDGGQGSTDCGADALVRAGGRGDRLADRGVRVSRTAGYAPHRDRWNGDACSARAWRRPGDAGDADARLSEPEPASAGVRRRGQMAPLAMGHR